MLTKDILEGCVSWPLGYYNPGVSSRNLLERLWCWPLNPLSGKLRIFYIIPTLCSRDQARTCYRPPTLPTSSCSRSYYWMSLIGRLYEGFTRNVNESRNNHSVNDNCGDIQDSNVKWHKNHSRKSNPSYCIYSEAFRSSRTTTGTSNRNVK